MPFIAWAQQTHIVRISVSANGKLLLNGKVAELETIEAEFKHLKKEPGAIGYYRENPQVEQPAGAMSVITLVLQYGLPVSMSGKFDFSDYVDSDGRSRPRKP